MRSHPRFALCSSRERVDITTNKRFQLPFVVGFDPFEIQRPARVLSKRAFSGTIGAGKSVTRISAARIDELSHCFESALFLGKPVQGNHRVAFEILTTGRVGGVEWVEQPLTDEEFDECIFGVLRQALFPAAKSPTVADIQLYRGGVDRIR